MTSIRPDSKTRHREALLLLFLLFLLLNPRGRAATVARIATVAVANPKEEKTAPPAKVGAGETTTASRCWLIHFADRDPMQVTCIPEATHAEILERHPDAVAAEPHLDHPATSGTH